MAQERALDVPGAEQVSIQERAGESAKEIRSDFKVNGGGNFRANRARAHN